VRARIAIAFAVGAVSGAACGDNTGPLCPADAGRCIYVSPGDDAYERIATALIDARPGDHILIREGTYSLRLGLDLLVDGVTIRGEGMDQTVLSFAGQLDGAQGLLVTGDNFTIEDIAIEDTAGDALKIEGARGVTIRRTRAEWTGGASTDNGAYGLYPVLCEDVLIEGSIARGASDAGIYVGQSRNIIVRDNLATENVAGIEIENSFDADVYNNVSTGNTGGVLIFNLPGLAVKNGARTRVFNNDIRGNNHPNFAPVGNIVGKVPQGTGIAMIAAHDVEVFANRIGDNQTANSAVISYQTTLLSFDDPDYDPDSDTVYFHHNVYTEGGTQPSGELGFLLVQALATVQTAPIVVPDVVFDGYIHPDKSDDGGATFSAPYNLCIREDPGTTFADIDAPNEFAAVSGDRAPHDCEHPSLGEVEL
jgi:parallel beta-helix repeat protein